MKIAVATEGDRVAEHFGHCQSFSIFAIKDKEIVTQQTVANPGHRPGYLPNYLHGLGTNVIISGGMGGGAIEIFAEKGIEVITGARGTAEAAVKKYLEGSLKSSGSVCHDHSY